MKFQEKLRALLNPSLFKKLLFAPLLILCAVSIVWTLVSVAKGGNTVRVVVDLVTVEDPVQTVVPTVTAKIRELFNYAG